MTVTASVVDQFMWPHCLRPAIPPHISGNWSMSGPQRACWCKRQWHQAYWLLGRSWPLSDLWLTLVGGGIQDIPVHPMMLRVNQPHCKCQFIYIDSIQRHWLIGIHCISIFFCMHLLVFSHNKKITISLLVSTRVWISVIYRLLVTVWK